MNPEDMVPALEDYADLMLKYSALGELLIEIVKAWDAVGFHGFICRDQGALPELLAKIAEAKRMVRG